MVCSLAYRSDGNMYSFTCCYPTVKGGSMMLSGNDYQAITQIIRDEMKKYEDPAFLKTRLKESQHEANSLSAQVCTKEKQLQKIKDILYRVQQQGNGLVVMTQMQYDQLLDILDGGIV